MKRLKIVEQIIAVLIFAVIIPFVTIGIIISNISQQSVRNELAISTSLMAEFVGDALQNYIKYSQAQLEQMASGFNYIPNTMAKIQYFDDIEAKTKIFKNLDILEKNKISKGKYEVESGLITLLAPIEKDEKYYLTAQIEANIIDVLLGKENIKGRNIFIFDRDTKKLIASNTPENFTKEVFNGLEKVENQKKALYGDKNTPKAYFRLDSPNWAIIVDTTTKVTAKTINKARNRIILSLCIAALSILIIVGLYTFYLYINVRQLFKGIKAVSQGNYDKKIHLIKSVFTPYEIVFLANEFNYMANKINISYQDLKEKNYELEKLNKFRENLVSSTSHEFRTPLTSIIGYTSRLLRHDIALDEKTKTHSLQIIKEQAQRLSRMVEDLLVIPELDSLSLKFNIEETDLSEKINRALDYLKSDEIDFIVDIKPDLKFVYADEYRLEQIIINLVDNAMKYSKDNSPVKIEAFNQDEFPVLKISNKCEKISDEIKEKLFDKFIRVDSNLTRTTRGTGLGLYIVKGLCEAMKIDISLEADEEFIMTLKFEDYVR